jgi:diguanylate cyclase (GGDEF)-like protein/PAS domain S-box-containing protein
MPGSSIRTRLALATSVFVAVISLFIYFYFPERLRRQATTLVSDEAYSVTTMAAISVASNLSDQNRPAVYHTLSELQQNRDIAWIVLFHLDDRATPFATYNLPLAEQYGFRALDMEPRTSLNPRGAIRELAAGGFTPDGRVYQTSVAVREAGRQVGEMFLGMSTDRLTVEVERNKRAVAGVAIAVFVLGVVAALAIAAAITRPLREIATTAKRIAAGNLAERASVTGTEEVQRLARSFNTMLARLESAQTELATLNRSLEERVEERTRELREEMTERRRAERRYRMLFERNLAGVFIASISGRIISCNDACARMLGYESSEDLLANHGSIAYFDPHEQQTVMNELLEHGSVANQEARLLRRDGDVIWVLETLTSSPADAEHSLDRTPALEGILLDITDRKRTEQEVEFQAYHDALTGLPNRMLFMDRLTVAVAAARRRHEPLAVMFLDLDDLKVVNDTLGHAAGDQLLQLVADRLIACLRQEDTVGRIGGDEFTLLLPDIASQDDAVVVAEKVIQSIQQPFAIGEDEVRVTTSIGVAMYPADGEDPETLLENADGTMYRVKEGGGAAYQFCSGSIGRRALGRMSMEDSLRHALERSEFAVFYQPQVETASGEVVAMEALVRWRHPDAGLIEPSGFISLAEHTGLIIPIGEWVLREACRQAKEWRDKGLPLRIGVNVSARQFHQRDFIGVIDRAIRDTKLPPEALELEITETMAMQKSERTITMLHRLRDRGIGIALDDFGTGQSSLTYLKRFPISTVKIDRSFISDLSRAMIDAPIVEAILHLASSLGLRTVAEGIETAEQWDFLAARGCAEMQGYYVSRPLEATDFESFLARPPIQRSAG